MHGHHSRLVEWCESPWIVYAQPQELFEVMSKCYPYILKHTNLPPVDATEYAFCRPILILDLFAVHEHTAFQSFIEHGTVLRRPPNWITAMHHYVKKCTLCRKSR